MLMRNFLEGIIWRLSIYSWGWYGEEGEGDDPLCWGWTLLVSGAAMAGGSNSKRPHHVNRATDSTNTQQGIIEGNNLQPQTQVQERVTVFDQHFYDGIPCFADVCFLHKSRSISKVVWLVFNFDFKSFTLVCSAKYNWV